MGLREWLNEVPKGDPAHENDAQWNKIEAAERRETAREEAEKKQKQSRRDKGIYP